MTDRLRDDLDHHGDHERRLELMDVRCFALLAAAVAAGALLYVNPALGLAVAGGVTVLATLEQLVRR